MQEMKKGKEKEVSFCTLFLLCFIKMVLCFSTIHVDVYKAADDSMQQGTLQEQAVRAVVGECGNEVSKGGIRYAQSADKASCL